MNGHILITGATGNVGAEVIRAFPTPAHLRVAVRQPAKLAAQFGDLATQFHTVAFDFTDPATFPTAFAGIERLFLIRPPAISDVPKYITPAIQAAKEAGVRHIVFLSLQGVERNRVVPHHKIEQAVRESGLNWTFLRAGFFMQNLSTTHRDEIRLRHEIAVPAGQSKTSFIDVRDIAAVAAKALTEPGHENQAYTLTGAEALDYDQIAAILSETLGNQITYRSPSLLRFVREQRQQGAPLGFALIMAALYTSTRFGMAAHTSPDVPAILRRPPIPFRQFAADYRASWL